MHVELKDWNNGWSGLSIGITKEEVGRLIELLQMIKNDPEQHFHISSDYRGSGGMGDIEISIKTPEQIHNMSLSGRALAPGKEI
jgi:hypothetical protein